MRTILLMTLAGLLAGCSGRYVLTVPDAAGPVGGVAPTTMRLQRYEVWPLKMPVDDASMRANLGETLRAAYTNDDGYATVFLPLPQEVGRYPLSVDHQDRFGDEVRRDASVYALYPQVLTLAVEWEALEHRTADAAAALRHLAGEGVQIVYLSPSKSADPEVAHEWLYRQGFPGGPILSWRARSDWRGLFGTPAGPAGSLPGLREQVPGLVVAVIHEDDAAAPLESVGITPIWLGRGGPGRLPRAGDWQGLVQTVLAAPGLRGRGDFTDLTPEAVRQALEKQ